MNNRRLNRANSFIRARKERAGNLLKKQYVTKLQHCADKPDRISSFLTIPNAFRQCTVTLPIIHSAIPKLLREKHPNPSFNLHFVDRRLLLQIAWTGVKKNKTINRFPLGCRNLKSNPFGFEDNRQKQ